MTHIKQSGRDIRFTFILATLTFIIACAQAPIDETSRFSEPPSLRPAENTMAKPKAGSLTLRPDHPETYVVASGDTLLDVAERFLEQPWRWSEIWRPAPNVDNPEKIYPGEVIELYYENGQPRLRLLSATQRPTLKLSPQVRVVPVSQPIPTVPRQAIASFLERSLVLNEQDWKKAPYIVGSVDDRIILAPPDRIYVRGLREFDQQHYQVFRPGEEYKDPASGRSLGVGGIYMGDAVLQEEGDPATLLITSTRKEIRPGDRLFPRENTIELYSFIPHPAPPDTEGQIITFLNDALVVSQYQSVVINLGEREGLEPGNMLAVFSADEPVTDPETGSTIPVSGKRAGLVMVYKVYDWLSYGLITEMTNPIRVQDRVREP
jgi:hypothetical protein